MIGSIKAHGKRVTKSGRPQIDQSYQLLLGSEYDEMSRFSTFQLVAQR